jgi:hypothetical protein
MQNLLQDFQEYSRNTHNLLIIEEIMDLRSSSEFVLMYTKEQDYSELLKVFYSFDELFPEEAFSSLTTFSSKVLAVLILNFFDFLHFTYCPLLLIRI